MVFNAHESSYGRSQAFPPILSKRVSTLKSIEADSRILADKVIFVEKDVDGVLDAVANRLTKESGRILSEKERDWLTGLAPECFRMSAVIGDGVSGYRLGRLAFAYGVAETIAAHMGERDITQVPTTADLQDFTKRLDKALDIVVPAVKKFLGENPSETRKLLKLIHQTRMETFEDHPARRPLWRKYLLNKIPVLAAPLYTFAKINAYGLTNEQIGTLGVGHQDIVPQEHVLLEELDKTTFNLMYGETPPFNPTLEDLTQRQLWSRMTALGKDKFLLIANALSAAFLFGNYVLGEMTGNPEYGTRLLQSSKTEITSFFQTLPIDAKLILGESVPKSVWGSLDKVFRADGKDGSPATLSDEMQGLYRQYFGEPFQYEKMLRDKYYFNVMKGKLGMFSELVRKYFTDPTDRENGAIEKFLLKVRAQMEEDVYDVHRVRGYVWEDDDKVPPGQNFDNVCQQIALEDESAFVILDARVDGRSEFQRVPLKEVITNGSAYAQIDRWYQSHLNQRNIERVYAAVVTTKRFSDTRAKGELQLIPIKNSLLAWQSRLNFKLYTEGEDAYTDYLQKDK